MKLKVIVSQIITLTVAALILTACQRQIPFKSTQKVSDPNSPLLGALVNRSELSGNWIWYREELSQRSEASTYLGHVLAEVAVRTVTGDYSAERYYTRVTHRLERFESGSPSLEDLKQQLEKIIAGEETSNTRTFSPTLISAGTGSVSKCVHVQDVKECWVFVRYDNMVSTLIFYTSPGAMNDGSVTGILNQILTTVDDRIGEIDK